MNTTIIQELDNLNLNLEKISVEELKNYFSEIFREHLRPSININPEGLFRGRIITNVEENDLNTTKAIWYPDFNEICEDYHCLNRCSDKGQNFFYSSNYLEATLHELSPNNDDLVMIGVFVKKSKNIKIFSQYAGIEALKNCPDRKKELFNYKYPSKEDEIIEQYISSKFQEKVKKGQEYNYKPSIAFSNILLKNEEINCIIYPSVASNLKLENYGIKPEFVDEHLCCKEVYIYRIKKDSIKYELIPIKYGKLISPPPFQNTHNKNSVIEWAENSDSHRNVTQKYHY